MIHGLMVAEPLVGAVTCTCTGDRRLILVPSPNWPCKLEPQLTRVPSALRATVCAPPAATARHGALMVTPVLPVTVPTVAVTVSVPTTLPVTMPVVPTVMLLPLAAQVRPVVSALVLLSVKVPVATNCWLVPMAMVELAGVMAIDTSVGVVVPPLEPLLLLPPPPPPPQAASTASKGINNRWRKLKA